MKHYILPARPIKAAMFFMAKLDPRYYLNGVHVNNAGYIEATNGRIAIRIECEESKSYDSIIVNIGGTIPNNADSAHILIDGCGRGYAYFEKSDGSFVEQSGTRKTFGTTEIEGNFPNIDRLLVGIEQEPTLNIMFNPEYIGLAGKACRALGSKFPVVKAVMHGENEVIKLEFIINEYNAYALIMPARY